ncbi:MAG TPA: carboxypeptidase-like regulatory domain-containing protein [Vicinamibacterales bacterium]|nr:carboxypeptidase-like regulatory domain-containing protein [Vicinamibacterales bacterium]
MTRTLAALLLLLSLPAQQGTRDTTAAPRPGTASLSGVIVTDGPSSAPIRNAIVTINDAEKRHGDTAISDEQGRFAFTELPAGRFTLVAQKTGHIRSIYGASRSGRAGTPIALADGQRVTDIQLRLVRGAVVTGTIRDADGQPMPEVAIEVLRIKSREGARELVDASWNGDGRTDDRGVYRLYDLGAGDYIIQATPRVDGMGGSGGQLTSTIDLQWARSQMQSGRTESTPAPARSSAAYAPVYYPGTVLRTSAAIVSLTAGEERSGLDMTMQTVPTSRITGVVNGPASPKESPEIVMVEVGPNASGFWGMQMTAGMNFVIPGVPPGTYALVARQPDAKHWATTDIVVTGIDQSVNLTLQPPMTASGRVQFRGAAPPPKDLTRIRVFMTPTVTRGRLVIAPEPASVKADGTFVIDGIMPGPYVLSLLLSFDDRPASAWSLKDARAAGQDVSTLPITVAGGNVDNIAVTLTDAPAELGGRLQDASGRGATDYFIVVFSTDERTWFNRSRAVVQVRPASDGSFSVRGLPAGEYWMAALTDLEQREDWVDPAVLRQLVPAAVKVTLADGEKKTQDIRIAGGGR